MPLNANSIVLTGFMGVGKSTIGRRLAARLGWHFVDLDEAIEAATGRTIPDLFKESEATFRWHEAQVLRDLPTDEPLVLATGGGTLVGQANRHALGPARIVWLDAPLDLLRTRLSGDNQRPLAPNAETLYAQRRAAYARLPFRTPVEDLTPDEAVDAIVALLWLENAPSTTTGDAKAMSGASPLSQSWDAKRFPFQGGGGGGLPLAGRALDVASPHGDPYPILIGEGIAAEIGTHLAAWGGGTVALITDSNVGPLWGETVRHDLMAARLAAPRLEMRAGEVRKTLDTVARLYDDMAEARVARDGAVVALGGGVVGDVAGFVAATWMRGVRRLVQLPTTLLAMVDASVGGKTGVDHPAGKNLIGAFRFPDLVLIDPMFLQTLPPHELRNGMAEVIKHGVIADAGLFERIERHEGPLAELVTSELIARAIQVKVEIVRRDPFERGERALLNLGHTFGHAYELASGFELPHGEAVAVGMVTAARLSERLGLAERGLAARIADALRGVGLPTAWHGASPERLWEAMQQDKKRAAAGLRFILPTAIGQCILTEPGAVPRLVVLEALDVKGGSGAVPD